MNNFVKYFFTLKKLIKTPKYNKLGDTIFRNTLLWQYWGYKTCNQYLFKKKSNYKKEDA